MCQYRLSSFRIANKSKRELMIAVRKLKSLAAVLDCGRNPFVRCARHDHREVISIVTSQLSLLQKHDTPTPISHASRPRTGYNENLPRHWTK